MFSLLACMYTFCKPYLPVWSGGEGSKVHLTFRISICELLYRAKSSETADVYIVPCVDRWETDRSTPSKFGRKHLLYLYPGVLLSHLVYFVKIRTDSMFAPALPSSFFPI